MIDTSPPKSILEMAIDVAFANVEREMAREHQTHVDQMIRRLEDLKREIALLYQCEASHEKQ